MGDNEWLRTFQASGTGQSAISGAPRPGPALWLWLRMWLRGAELSALSLWRWPALTLKDDIPGLRCLLFAAVPITRIQPNWSVQHNQKHTCNGVVDRDRDTYSSSHSSPRTTKKRTAAPCSVLYQWSGAQLYCCCMMLNGAAAASMVCSSRAAAAALCGRGSRNITTEASDAKQHLILPCTVAVAASPAATLLHTPGGCSPLVAGSRGQQQSLCTGWN